MKVFDCVQYSEEWWLLRQALPTASNFDRIITAVTGKPSSAQLAYACELAAELTFLGPNFFTERQDRPKSLAMQVGTDTEPEARRYYEMLMEAEVEHVGFCLSDCGRYGCSPDGLVKKDGVRVGALELKCPELKTHAGYLLSGDPSVPAEYRPQVHGHLVVTGLPWCDFLSYAPPLDPFRVRVVPNGYTTKLKQCIEDFCGEYDEVVKKLGLEEKRAEVNRNRIRNLPA